MLPALPWLLPAFLFGGLATIHFAHRWAPGVTRILTGTVWALTLLLLTVLTYRSAAFQVTLDLHELSALDMALH